MSLRAVHLTLEIHARDQAADLARSARQLYYAMSAAWDGKALGRFNEEQKKLTTLADVRTPEPQPRKRANIAQLVAFLSALGAQEEKPSP